MPNRRSREPGTFVIVPLGDGTYAYGRLLEPSTIAFYRHRTNAPESDLDKIASCEIAFKVGVLRSDANKWTAIGHRELESELEKPFVMFMQDLGDFRKCTIVDTAGNERSATPEECEGLERVATWEAQGVVERLLDVFADRPNETAERMRVRRK